ncbi:Plant self-incompatibility protein S1 family [Euphorbia peplus]|nr:Plant self-incompatibility protein S1 family [Euphorbia peplus]
MQILGKISYPLLLLLLGFSFCNPVCSDSVHASVMNRLGNGRNLTLHCQSKDNDLGQQSLTDGSEFSWDFSVNVGGTTLFYCDMKWENVQQYHFDAYSFPRDYTRFESQCLWLVSVEGVYALNGKTGFWEYVYHWPN